MSAIDRTILHICRERAGLSLKHVDFDIAKHLACIVREDPTVQVRKKGESVALCAALVERADGGWDDSESVVVRVWGLDTREKRVAFLEEYTDLLFRCFLPPLVVHGFSFDAHGQNTRSSSLRNCDWKTTWILDSGPGRGPDLAGGYGDIYWASGGTNTG